MTVNLGWEATIKEAFNTECLATPERRISDIESTIVTNAQSGAYVGITSEMARDCIARLLQGYIYAGANINTAQEYIDVAGVTAEE